MTGKSIELPARKYQIWIEIDGNIQTLGTYPTVEKAVEMLDAIVDAYLKLNKNVTDKGIAKTL